MKLRSVFRSHKHLRLCFFNFMPDFDSFTGGVFDTNCFYLSAPEGNFLIDAPAGALDWLQSKDAQVDLLLLTHGHVDHILDAAKIQKAYGCPVGYHKDGEAMLMDPTFFKKFGFGLEVEPLEAGGFLIDESAEETYLGRRFQVLLVPGHCPGSLCFFDRATNELFGGDVLFAGGVGRWDLPGGDREVLLSGIKSKLFPLGDPVTVYPGHGPATTIGRERATNPYLF